MAGFVALFISLLAYWVSMALPNVYTSYATVLVEPQTVDEELVKAGVPESDLNQRLHLMTAEILSRSRLTKIIDDFGLYEDESEYMLREEIIDLMRERVTVEPVLSDLQQGSARQRADAEINEFRISFDDYSRGLARDVAEKLANDFIENHIDARVKISQKSLDFIDSELQRLADRIRVIEGEVKEVKDANPGMNPEDFAANQRRLERLMSTLSSAQRELSTAVSDYEFYKSQANMDYSAPNDDASPARRADILRLQLAELRARGLTEKHPDVVKSSFELESIEEMLAGEGEDGNESAFQTLRNAEIRRAEIRAIAAQEEVARIEGEADEIERLILGTPGVVERLDGLMREYEHLSGSYQDFSNRQLEATVQAQLERRQLGEQFRVLESAFLAPEPSAPNRILIIVLGVILGLAIGVGAAVLVEAVDTSAHDARTLQTRMQLPVLAAIPEIWLESDRIAQRRQRLRMAFATAGLVVFALVGGSANYLWVNGLPLWLQSPAALEGESTADSRS